MRGRDEVYRQGACRGIAEHEAGRLHDQLTQTRATPATVQAESAADTQEGGTAPETEDTQLRLMCTQGLSAGQFCKDSETNSEKMRCWNQDIVAYKHVTKTSNSKPTFGVPSMVTLANIVTT